MSKPVSLVDREIELKVDAAVRAEIAKGKKASDMGGCDFRNMAKAMHNSFSPVAKQELAYIGLEHVIKFILGAKIAEVIWNDGIGWPADDAGVLSAASRVTIKGKPLKQPEADALENYNVFREALPDLTQHEFNEMCEAEMIERFQCLFVGQPEGRSIGEIATVKAISGDKTALSFLAWRPVQCL